VGDHDFRFVVLGKRFVDMIVEALSS